MVAMTQTVLDDFEDGSLTGWSTWGGATHVETGGELRISSVAEAAFAFIGVDYGSTVDYDEAYYGALLVDPGDIDGIESYSINTARGVAEGINFAWIIRETGVANPVLNFGSVGDNLDYDPEVHRYFAVGVHEGNLEWVWSTDGVEWTVHHSQPNTLGTTVFTPSMMVGTDAAEDDTTTARWDDFSVWVRSTGQNVQIGSATEADTGQQFTATKVRTLTAPTEADAAQGLDAGKTRALGAASETSAAQALDACKTRTLGTATDTTAAQAFGCNKARIIGTAGETSTAQTFGRAKTRAVGTATTAHLAASLSTAGTIGTAQETSAAQPLHAAKAMAIAVAVETWTAGALTAARRVSLGTASTGHTAAPLALVKGYGIGTATTGHAAGQLGRAKTRSIGAATSAHTASPLLGGAEGRKWPAASSPVTLPDRSTVNLARSGTIRLVDRSEVTPR